MSTLKHRFDILKSLLSWFYPTRSYKKYVFITGAPRSGTTLLKTILTVHPLLAGGDYESTGVFKIRNLYNYTCGEIDNGWINVSFKDSKGLIDFYEQLVDALLDYYEGEVFVDKIWPQKFRLKYVTSRFPEAKWIHIIRDGKDSFCSAKKHPNIPQSTDLSHFARYWHSTNKMIEKYIPTNNHIKVFYETLTGSPEDEINRIMNFLGYQVDERQFYPGGSGQVSSVHKREYHSRLTQPLDQRSVGRSNSELSETERNQFNTIAGTLLKKYGYFQ